MEVYLSDTLRCTLAFFMLMSAILIMSNFVTCLLIFNAVTDHVRDSKIIYHVLLKAPHCVLLKLYL